MCALSGGPQVAYFLVACSTKMYQIIMHVSRSILDVKEMCQILPASKAEVIVLIEPSPEITWYKNR
jgi:hypothetical protein